MTEHDLIGGLADVEKQLKDGNGLTAKVLAVLGQIGDALKKLPAAQITVPVPDVNVAATRVNVEAPTVNAPVTVLVPPAAEFDWEHVCLYDDVGKLTKIISTRVARNG